LGYDDSLDAFGVHGVGGTLGAILTGVFATKIVGGGAVPLGLLEELKTGAATTALDQPGILTQTVAALITWGVAAIGTFVLLKVLDVAMGLRVSQREEIQGLDLSQHGEEGYIFI
jgi:Amt family ammonium transporter